jgi:hypothetical protein
MLGIWDPRAAFDLYPEEPGFICSGITQRGLRCRQSFIANRDKSQASDILDDLLTDDNVFDNPRALYPDLKKLAELTLCPRWHRTGNKSQVDAVASKWLRSIQEMSSGRAVRNSRTNPRRNVLPTPTAIRRPFLPTEWRTDFTPASVTPASSRSRSNRSQALSSLPTPPVTPRQSPSSSRRSTVAPVTPDTNTVQISVTVTVSSANGETTSTNVSQQLPRDSPPSTTTISVSSGLPQTVVNISNTPLSQNLNALSPSVARRSLSVSNSGRSTPRAPSTIEPSSISEAWVSETEDSEGEDNGDSASEHQPSHSESLERESVQPSAPPSPLLRMPRAPAPSITSVARQQRMQICRRPLTDPCPVCLLDINDPSDAVWCKASCGQNVCNDCFGEWREASIDQNIPLKCVYW